MKILNILGTRTGKKSAIGNPSKGMAMPEILNNYKYFSFKIFKWCISCPVIV